ncbi:hypothetical protein M9H77_23407 [Catharanthus roseus]|uniref:Uncharacterized protein n=1 Tax=Catharanthus roseus TaxID=4058 RepID=A0ACC0AU62_CATRO|nr:hypothetical protein M9H77_23407 [Catharanthus roseus]
MGHSSKKKKKRSGGRRTPSKDHDSFSAQNAELISDELTALCAIFQEDCEVARGSPPQVNIKLRFIPGYPNKCPKLQIVPEKGLSETDTEKLLSLLHDQANSNSREGRVMIYSLVEAAQEFLSEIVPKSQTHESVRLNSSQLQSSFLFTPGGSILVLGASLPWHSQRSFAFKAYFPSGFSNEAWVLRSRPHDTYQPLYRCRRCERLAEAVTTVQFFRSESVKFGVVSPIIHKLAVQSLVLGFSTIFVVTASIWNRILLFWVCTCIKLVSEQVLSCGFMTARGGRGNRGHGGRYGTVEMFKGLREQVTQLTQLVTQVLGNQNHRTGINNGSDRNQGVRNEEVQQSDGETGSSSDDSSAQAGGFAQLRERPQSLKVAIQDQVSLQGPYKVIDAYRLALKVESQLSRSISKKAGFDHSNNTSTSKVGNGSRGGRTVAPLRSNQPTKDSGKAVQIHPNKEKTTMKCYRCFEFGPKSNEYLKRAEGRVNMAENENDDCNKNFANIEDQEEHLAVWDDVMGEGIDVTAEIVASQLAKTLVSFGTQAVPSQATETSKLSCKDGASSSSMIYSSRGPFAYAYLDLFSGSGESWHWNLTMEGNTAISSSARSNPLEDSKYVDPNLLNRVEQKLKPAAVQEAKQDFTFNPPLKLVTVHEETEDESKSTDSSRTLSYESVGSGAIVEDTFVEENAEDTDDDDLDSNPSKPDCSESLVHNQSSQTMKIDLILAHLLRLACAPKGQLRDVLPQITSELCDLGVVSEHVRDLAIKPSSDFDITFNDVFGHHMVSIPFKFSLLCTPSTHKDRPTSIST